MGTAAKLSCSADWANKLDQAKRRKEADNMATHQLTQAMHKMTTALHFVSARQTNLSPMRLTFRALGDMAFPLTYPLTLPLTFEPTFVLLQNINK